MHATFLTLWLQVVQPLANVHETKWTPHVKRETDVAQSYTSSGIMIELRRYPVCNGGGGVRFVSWTLVSGGITCKVATVASQIVHAYTGTIHIVLIL